MDGEEPLEDTVRKFLRDPPTNEEIDAHNALKKCLNELQQTAVEKLEHVLDQKGWTDFKLDLSQFNHVKIRIVLFPHCFRLQAAPLR